MKNSKTPLQRDLEEFYKNMEEDNKSRRSSGIVLLISIPLFYMLLTWFTGIQPYETGKSHINKKIEELIKAPRQQDSSSGTDGN